MFLLSARNSTDIFGEPKAVQHEPADDTFYDEPEATTTVKPKLSSNSGEEYEFGIFVEYGMV